MSLYIRRIAGLGLSMLALLLITMPFASAAELPDARTRGIAVDEEIGTLFEQHLGVKPEAPVFTDLGDGFFSLSYPLSPEMREKLLVAVQSETSTELTGKAAQTLFVISVGQAPTTPSDPITTTHGALSDTTFPYTYWIITLNLGRQNVTKATTLKLTGPGLKFTRSANVVYGANGIWVVGYRPDGGVRTPGVYTLQGTVAGGGSITVKSFAVNP
jgi:hypothetical protein